MKRKTIHWRALGINPLSKGPWRLSKKEAIEDAGDLLSCARVIVQGVEIGSPVKIFEQEELK